MKRFNLIIASAFFALLSAGCQPDVIDNMSMRDAKAMYNALSPTDKETVKGCLQGSLSVVNSVLTCTLPE